MKPFVPGRPHWWQWLTILSLDAPVVAVLWQWLLARVAGIGHKTRFRHYVNIDRMHGRLQQLLKDFKRQFVGSR